MREALFSILGDRVEGAAVLDLFAGSGALGLEALSRGAASATFVEQRTGRERVLRANVETLGAEAEIVRADALRWLGGARAARANTISSSSTRRTGGGRAGSPALGAAARRYWRRERSS